MCNEFSQIFQLCQFVMVSRGPTSHLPPLPPVRFSTQTTDGLPPCRRTPRMPRWSRPRWRRCSASSTGSRLATSLRPNSSARSSTRCSDRVQMADTAPPSSAPFQSLTILSWFVQFLNVPMFRNVTLKCLTEIAGVNVNQYEDQFVNLFTLTMGQLKQVRAHTRAR